MISKEMPGNRHFIFVRIYTATDFVSVAVFSYADCSALSHSFSALICALTFVIISASFSSHSFLVFAQILWLSRLPQALVGVYRPSYRWSLNCHTTCPRFAYFGHVRLEFDQSGIFSSAQLSAFGRLCRLFCGRSAPPPVSDRIGDVAENIKRGCGRYMTYRSRQRFHIHTVFQRHSRECVPEIMETYFFAFCPFQYQL